MQRKQDPAQQLLNHATRDHATFNYFYRPPVLAQFQPFDDVPTGARVMHPGYLSRNSTDLNHDMQMGVRLPSLRSLGDTSDWTEQDWLMQHQTLATAPLARVAWDSNLRQRSMYTRAPTMHYPTVRPPPAPRGFL
jgi:hypothetical protein